MSDFEIRIVFHGLIGLAPTGDGRFLLPLPRVERGLDLDPLPERVPPHLPCVVVPRKYRTPPQADPPCSPATPDLEFQRPFEDEDQELPFEEEAVRQVFRFKEERLTLDFSGSGSGVSAVLSELDPETHQHPSQAGAPPENDLAWMPSLEHTGIPGADQLDARLMTADFVPVLDDNLNRLIGTVLLDGGNLSSTGVVQAANDQDAIFKFIPAGNPGQTTFRQAMFQRMVWTASASGEGLQLVFTRELAGIQIRRCLQLRPRDGQIDLDVYNRELEDILRLGSDTDFTSGATDPDFAVSYWTSRAWDAIEAGDADAVIPEAPPLGEGGSGEACKDGRSTGIS